MPADPLTAEVERAMESAGVINYPWRTVAVAVCVEMVRKERANTDSWRDAHNAVWKDRCLYMKRAEAAEKALAEQRERWGHAPNCYCHRPECCDGYYRVSDPRCAQPGGGERDK